MTNNDDQFYQDPPAARSGESFTPLSDIMRRPEPLEPEETQCIQCGDTFLGERWNWPVRIESQIYPGKKSWGMEPRFKDGGLCQKCKAEQLEEKRQAAELARQAELATIRRRYRLTCGIKEKYQNQDFSTYLLTGYRQKFRTAWKAAMDYADGFPITERGKGYRSFVIVSEQSWGVGKTHLASAIAHRVLDRWDGSPEICPVRMISEYEIMNQITATYNYTPEERQARPGEEDILRSLIYVPLLIIDDVGKRRARDLRFLQRILFSIIDGRDNADRPIVLTANLDAARLGKYLGGIDPDDSRELTPDEASLDRLIGMCGGHFVKMDGRSFRRGQDGQ